MKGMWVLLLAGCATAGAGGHAARPSGRAYALDAVTVGGIRAGQLSASREWHRADGSHAVRADTAADLQEAFVRDLARRVPLAPDASARLRVTLVLQTPGYYEGLAPETSDVAVTADVFDRSGVLRRSVTLREPASAPLQRPTSRQQRLDAALDRLAARLAAVL